MISNPKRHDCIITKEKSLYVKSAAILLMLIHHLFTFPDRLPEGGYISLFSLNGLRIEQFIGGFGKVCVGVFVFLSGYGLYISYYSKEVTVKSMLYRVLKFYLHFWKICLLFIPLGIILGRLTINFKEIFFNMLGIHSTLNGEWWFIYLYVLLVLLFPLLLKLVKHVNGGMIFSISLVLVLVSNYIDEDYLKQFLIYQVFFVMGILVCRYAIFDNLYLLLKKFKGMKWITLGLLVCLPILYLILLKLPFIYQFNFVIVTFILVYGIGTLPFDSRLLKRIGKNSTNIWLIHSFFCYYYFKEFIYAPRYSILIFSWLLLICLITSEGINGLTRIFSKRIKKMQLISN